MGDTKNARDGAAIAGGHLGGLGGGAGGADGSGEGVLTPLTVPESSRRGLENSELALSRSALVRGRWTHAVTTSTEASLACITMADH